VKGAQHLDAATLDDIFRALVSRAKWDGHLANGAAKLALDLARAAVEAEPTDPDVKPLESMSAEERIALYTRLLREESQEEEAGTPLRPLAMGLRMLVAPEQLATLRDQGVLTEDEFASQKAKLLST
jgi:hypothetical protein